MAYDSNKGISALASVIQGKAKQAADGIPMSLDFGVINGDFSLKTNTFGKPIPRSDYSVCRLVTGYTLATSDSSWTGHLQNDKHNHGSPSGVPAHSHDVPMPGLKAGDRVLVAWVQNEAVVIDVVVRA